MWLTDLSKLKWIAIALLSFALLLTTLHSRALKAERDAKIAEIQAIKTAAEQYKTESERIAKEISNGHQALLDTLKAKDLAIKNARARFGSCTVVRGVGTVGVLPSDTGVSEAGGAERTDESHQQESLAVGRDFIDACAEDAGVTELWKQWAIANGLEVK